ncbi:MAG: hypothetical protein KAQ95_12775, partial [Candidatus Heimdallarchaeota archaeon]|nr:hypothetical protein [Candidatus Heimdallarchaeota archaeon]
MDVGPLTTNRIHKTRKQITVYLILLVILVPVIFLRQELKTESIPNTKEEKLYETAQTNDMANFSIINNEFNIFYKDIIIKDDLAFINNKYSIVIYNITNPEEPKILSESARCTNEILKMQVEGDTLFIGFNFHQSNYYMTKIQAFNISEPTIIESVGCFIYYNFYDFVIKDNYGYITTIGDGMLIFSVQDPTNMYTVGEYGGLSNAHYKIAVS